MHKLACNQVTSLSPNFLKLSPGVELRILVGYTQLLITYYTLFYYITLIICYYVFLFSFLEILNLFRS
jgi:hypothetical protein